MSNHSTPHFKDSHPTALEVEELEELLRTYRPSPNSRLVKKVAIASWMKSSSPLPNQRTRTQIPGTNRKMVGRWAFLFLSGLLVFSLAIFTNIGRGLAQSIFQFFQKAPAEHVTELVSLTPMPTSEPGYPDNLYTLSVSQAEILAGFKVKVLTNLPDGWVFHGASYEPKTQRVGLSYALPNPSNSPNHSSNEEIYIYVFEQKGEFENFMWGECPDGTITEVRVNGWPAELADGTVWTTTSVFTPGSTVEWICEKVAPGTTMSLRWEEADLKYEINVTQIGLNDEREGLRHDTVPWLKPEDLLNLAEQMK